MFGIGEKKNTISGEQMEALLANVKLLAEDAGWKKSGTAFDDISEDDRQKLVERSREYFVKHPSYARIVSLNKSFVLGKGINRPNHENPIIQYIIDKIWSSVENETSFTGYKAFETQIEQRDISGEIFYKIYVETVTGQCTVRVETDPFAVKNVITDPNDRAKILGYEYEYLERVYNPRNKGYDEGKKITKYIPHIYNETGFGDPANYPSMDSGSTKCYGYLACFGSGGMKEQRRGMPMYYQILPWLKAHREICEDAASFIKALAKFAWRKKMKGVTKETMNGLVALGSTFNAAGNINKTPTVTASTLIENGQSENEALEIKQNPEVFVRIADLLLQQVASGSDKMKHYFANPENANLATATSMELPMLKDFQRQQKGLLSVVTKVLSFCVIQYLKVNQSPDVLMVQVEKAGYEYNEEKRQDYIDEMVGVDYTNLGVAAYGPKIVDKNLSQTISGIVAAYNAGLITDKDATYQIYELFEYDNVDEIISQLFGDGGPGTLKAGMDGTQDLSGYDPYADLTAGGGEDTGDGEKKKV